MPSRWQPIGSKAEQLVAQFTNILDEMLNPALPPLAADYWDRLIELKMEGDRYCAEVDQAVARMHAHDMRR